MSKIKSLDGNTRQKRRGFLKEFLKTKSMDDKKYKDLSRQEKRRMMREENWAVFKETNKQMVRATRLKRNLGLRKEI